jgi:hypothetical protein
MVDMSSLSELDLLELIRDCQEKKTLKNFVVILCNIMKQNY